jgi:hypothetical protein
MKVRIMASGLLTLLALMTIYLGTASASPNIPTYKITLHGAAGMSVHGGNVGTPVVRTNGHNVALTVVQIQGANTYAPVNQNDIQNYWLEVTVPAGFNLDLQVPNGTIMIDGVRGTMTLATYNGTTIINNSTLVGKSNISTKYGSLQFNGKQDPKSTSYFTGVNASINITLPANTKLHLKANAQQAGNLTGNFNGLPNNAPQTFDGFLNATAGDPGLTEISLSVVSGSMSVNHQ